MEIKSLATVAMIESVIYDFCSTGSRIPDYGLQDGRVINSYPRKPSAERGPSARISGRTCRESFPGISF